MRTGCKPRGRVTNECMNLRPVDYCHFDRVTYVYMVKQERNNQPWDRITLFLQYMYLARFDTVWILLTTATSDCSAKSYKPQCLFYKCWVGDRVTSFMPVKVVSAVALEMTV